MACKHCEAAHSALLDLIVGLKVDMAHVHEAIMEHDERLDGHDEDIGSLLEEDEIFESEDEEDEDE